MYVGLHVKCPLFFSDFNETTMFSVDFLKILKTLNLMKIRRVRAELPLPDGERAYKHDEADSRFSQISERA
jgi:hypothetical protein